jgi:N-acetylneuraminic acid mutarotase
MGVANDWSARLRFALQCVLAMLVAACGGNASAPEPDANSAPAANTQPAPTTPEPPAAYPIAVVANAACVLDGFIYVTGGYGNRDAQGNADFVGRAYRYSPRENQWERLPDMPVARCFHGCVAAEGKVWLFGGMSRAGDGSPDFNVAQVDCYDPEARKWTTPTNLPTPRNRLAAGAIGTKVYVVGGMDREDTDLVEILDTSTFKWSDGARLPAPSHGHALAAVGDKLVVAGGSVPDVTWIFEAGKWREGGKLPGAHLFAAAVAVNGAVLLLGNRDRGESPLLRYDLKADKWEQISDKSVQTHRTAAVYLDGKVYVIAGEDPEGGELSRVSRYDPVTGAWEHGP